MSNTRDIEYNRTDFFDAFGRACAEVYAGAFHASLVSGESNRRHEVGIAAVEAFGRCTAGSGAGDMARVLVNWISYLNDGEDDDLEAGQS